MSHTAMCGLDMLRHLHAGCMRVTGGPDGRTVVASYEGWPSFWLIQDGGVGAVGISGCS